MFAPPAGLKALEENALHHLQSVDLTTPMQQLDGVFEALIDVPTQARRADTDFTRQALEALEILLSSTERLAAVVHTLTEHVQRSVPGKTVRENVDVFLD